MLADLALSAAVRAALKENEPTRETNIEIESKGGKVVLRGIVLNAPERAEAERIATTVAGAGKVDNQLRLMVISGGLPTPRPELAVMPTAASGLTPCCAAETAWRSFRSSPAASAG